MSQLAELLKKFYKESNYRSVAALTRSAQSYTSISQSYIKQLMRGIRQNPSYDKLMAIAQALDLSREATNQLLETAGYPPLPTANYDEITPQIQRILDALIQLRQAPGIPATAFETIADGVLRMVDGMRAAFNVGMPGGLAEVEEKKPGPSLRVLPAASLPPIEGALDDLLGDILSRSDEHPLGDLFSELEQAASEGRWETKRRITEVLPQLAQMQPDVAIRLATVLRGDYHPDYRADIRRRVVEAVPALHQYRPEASLDLLAWHEQDEIYVAMAILEVLHDLEEAGSVTPAVARRYVEALHFDEPLHREVIGYLNRLLQGVRAEPATALTEMEARQDDPERLVKIVIQRIAPRLLNRYPHEVLDMMIYFLRWNDDGFPVEHQNIRRPVSKALPQIFELLPDASAVVREKIAQVLQSLALDPDIHVRRALGDALVRLVNLDSDLAVTTMDALIQDQDPYVLQRTWHALLQLIDLYPDKAQEYYLKLLTAAA